MLKRLAPAITIILALMCDTSIFPFFYNGKFSIAFSLITVIMISLLCGRYRGLLYGLIAGLILDFTTGTLGMKLFAYLAFGFIVGFLLDHQPDLYDTTIQDISKSERRQYLLARFIWIGILLFIHEIAMLVLQYFSNSTIEWVYLRDIVIRVLLTSVLILLLTPVYHRFYIGKGDAARMKDSTTREVKDY